VHTDTIALIENGQTVWPRSATIEAIMRALTEGGVELIEGGVRLRGRGA